MTIKIAINGFGRMGRLALRAAREWNTLDIVHINEIAGDCSTAAHLLKYDSIHGIWHHEIQNNDNTLSINGKTISYSSNNEIDETPWSKLGVDLVIDCTGKFKSRKLLQTYLNNGVKKVIVSAPVKDGALNIVMGVNQHKYDPSIHHIVTAASCTTNCIAPVVDVVLKKFGIKHGCFTTIHNLTNTQSILDEYHKDLRRSRACGQSLIPTTTGSAAAITEIFPELKSRIDGLAVRVPLANASLTDCVFELETETTKEQVNDALEAASTGYLKGILGYEEQALVSVDYTNDKRSAIIDALSTNVVNKTQLKLFAWYDNEIGYVNRMMELAVLIGKTIR